MSHSLQTLLATELKNLERHGGLELRIGSVLVRISADALTLAMGESSLTMTPDSLTLISPLILLNPDQTD